MGEIPWVRVYCRGVNRGGGILLTSQLAVTAAHCLPGITLGHSSDAVAAAVRHGAALIPATLIERIDSKDLALVKLSQPADMSARLPWASRCNRGDDWFAPSRPALSDPELNGSVTGTMIFKCFSGGVIHAIQLTTQANLGSYDGYSGGPVFLSPEDSNKVIGILIEQYPDRIDLDRATNVLFAAAIEGVIEQFDTLGTGYLLRSLIFEGSGKPSAEQRNPPPLSGVGSTTWEDAKRAATTVLGWQGSFDVVDPEVRSVHQALVSKWVTQYNDEAGELT